MLRPVAELVSEVEGLSSEELAALYTHPYLVVEPFATVVESGFTTAQARSSNTAGGAITCAPVRKREDCNSFASMVTLGRAGNNDIEIPGDEVSKFHAYFVRDKAGRWNITDAGSSFGTFVAGEQLRHGKVLLEDGVSLRFGRVSATYYAPAGFVKYLKTLAEV